MTEVYLDAREVSLGGRLRLVVECGLGLQEREIEDGAGYCASGARKLKCYDACAADQEESVLAF